MEAANLPETDSPEVMEQAVSLWLTGLIWDQHWRDIHPDAIEEALLGLYQRVYSTVHKAHEGK